MSNTSAKKIVVRFPPSPTGYLQVGNVRTFLFNYLYAKKMGGAIVLRIEDTDKERSKKEYEDGIIEDLTWLGLTWDEGPYRQSERAEVHKEYLKKMVDEGKAYVSKEEAAEGKRSEVIRFKNPGRDVSFHDSIRGQITMHTGDLGDFVIAKDFDTPLYHLAVIIDDYEMGITHVIRGEDHISNTPRQILLLEAIGAPVPEYTHLPLMLAADRSKLSKRNGSVSIRQLREDGYLPEAIVNALAMIGWTPTEEGEVYALDALISLFDVGKLHHSGAVWNIEKLRWFNRQYLQMLDPGVAADTLQKFLPQALREKAKHDPALWERVAPTLLERIHYFGEIVELAGKGEVGFFFERPSYDGQALRWKESQHEDEVVKHLEWVRGAVDNFEQHEYTTVSISAKIMVYAEEQGRGAVLWPMRFALSGAKRSPDPFTLAYVLGKDETLARLAIAIKKLQGS